MTRNASISPSSALVAGPRGKPDIGLSNLGMILEFDGRAVQIGSSAAILGHPLRSLVMAAKVVARAGEKLEAGDIVLAGGLPLLMGWRLATMSASPCKAWEAPASRSLRNHSSGEPAPPKKWLRIWS